MKQLKQWIVCNSQKVPVNVSGVAINPHDPANWMTYDEAVATAGLLNLHIGFVLTESDPFFCIDIDKQLDSLVAKQLLEIFDGCYIEKSVSGNGWHIFGNGKFGEHSKKNGAFGVELYTSNRFILVTGIEARGSSDTTPSDTNLQWLVDSYFPPKAATVAADWCTDEPAIDDDVLVGKMLSARTSAAQAFGGKATIKQLWEADEQALAVAYPAIGESSVYDRSSADAALASHLAFWTAKNHSQIERLMRRSALVRDKWDRHQSYMTMTITNAVGGCQSVYQPVREREPEPAQQESDTLAPKLTTGDQFMSAYQQVKYFKDCIYVTRNHGMLVPNGTILKPDQFKSAYSGYSFALDPTNLKVTKNAWEAFIDNQAVEFPKVDGLCFRPKLKPFQLINEEGFTLVNSYKPFTVKKKKGDPTPFLKFMEKLLPVKSDRDIVLGYMAAMVQRVGTKFQWCPILQGTEGNGKTMLFRVVENAVGSRLTHYPNFSDGNALKFNGWIEGKVAVFIEEVYVSDRREVTEPLKVFVTNERMEIQHKGGNQYTGDNYANIMMATNHRDAMKITVDQRRYFVVFTGQQSESDLKRDGMTGAYFSKMYDWLRDDGYEIMAEFLSSYDIPADLNLTGRAPKSSSTDELILSSLGIVEQSILEAVEENRQGFRGNYISSKRLGDLIDGLKLKYSISPYRRKAMLETLGYRHHPWLKKGRVDTVVSAEGGRIVIYYKGELGNTQFGSAAVKAAYEEAQGYIAAPKNLELVK